MKNSLTNHNFSEMAGGNRFASSDRNSSSNAAAEAIAQAIATRDRIVQGKPLTVNQDGTTGDRNSIRDPNATELKDGNKFASPQWYTEGRGIQQWEIEHAEMLRRYPSATLEVLKDDRLAWHIAFPGILDANGGKHLWQFMLIYDSDHPHNRDYGGSVKVYPIRPTYEEMVSMARNAGRSGVPHVLNDTYGHKRLCTAPHAQVQANSVETVTAVTVAGWTASWANHFQIGLTDSAVWAKFCQH